MVAVRARNFNLSHPQFLENSMNSLLITCKNHFYVENLDSEQWATFREIHGPSKLIKKKFRVNTKIQIHKKLYFSGISYRLGHYVIPNINLENFVCKKWAHCSIVILSTGGKRSREGKIFIDSKKLNLCFLVKLFLSHKMLFSSSENFYSVLQKVNLRLSTNVSRQEFFLFLNTSGNILTYLFD